MLNIRDQLSTLLRTVVADQADDLLDAAKWEMPKDATFGDLSCPIAFKLASRQRLAPPLVAKELARRLGELAVASPLSAWVERIDSVHGFVNVHLSQSALSSVLQQVFIEGGAYGTSRAGAGQRILIEFVSANPTGPLSVAHGRQAAVGDALGNVLRAQGYDVTKEYYLNDEGRQIEMLGRSLRARYVQQLGQDEPFPEDGYHGAYVTEVAAELVKQHGDALRDAPLERFVEIGMASQLERIKDDLTRFGLTFDRWESQRQLRIDGHIDRALEALRAQDCLFEQDGATWFASTRFGDDKDRVVKKQTGELTYLAPDIAYHQLKFQRGYGRVINLWGPDHHGYIARIKAAVTALGQAADRLTVKIVQLVTLTRAGKVVPMSKRQGEFVTFREIMQEVGVDATRYFYLMRTAESHLDFDLELAKSQSQENPVYYVQYAHARICSVIENFTKQLPEVAADPNVDGTLLDQPEERLMLRQLFQFPSVVTACAQSLEAQGVTVYLQKLAELFHVFYTKHRVISDDLARSRARLALVQATRIVLANGLGLLGVSAPQRM